MLFAVCCLCVILNFDQTKRKRRMILGHAVRVGSAPGIALQRGSSRACSMFPRATARQVAEICEFVQEAQGRLLVLSGAGLSTGECIIMIARVQSNVCLSCVCVSVCATPRQPKKTKNKTKQNKTTNKIAKPKRTLAITFPPQSERNP